tara:strand:+ start:116 stop:361 length:246 start_codon:yes stop_codon:yes gene_type:complete
MKSYKLYLPKEKLWDAICLRYQHIFKSLDIVENEVRVYIEGTDFYESDAPHPLPYATINGKKKSMDNLFTEAIGEKELYES